MMTIRPLTRLFRRDTALDARGKRAKQRTTAHNESAVRVILPDDLYTKRDVASIKPRSLEANKAYAVAGFPVFRFDFPACRLKCPCLRMLGNWSKGIEFWAQNAAREPLEWIGLKVFPFYFPGGRELTPNARN